MKKNKRNTPNIQPRAGLIVKIEQDDSPDNPRNEFDQLSIFYGPRNGRYLVGGKQDNEVERWELAAYVAEYKREGAVIVPFHNPNVGDCYAIVDRATVKREYGNDSRSSLYHARNHAQGEIDQWLNWCNGEVYGYIVEDAETGEHVDSCWGYYGREYCEEEAAAALAGLAEDREKDLAQIDSRFQIVTKKASK